MKVSRTLFKSISWRIVAIVVTSIIAFSVTGSLVLAGSIVGIDASIKIILFMVHEWLWERKRYGRSITTDGT